MKQIVRSAIPPLTFVVAALLVPAASLRVSAESSVPSMATAADDVCNAHVHGIMPLDAAPDRSASDYAVWLGAFVDQPARLSGTLRVYAGDDRYDIPFSDVPAAMLLHPDKAQGPVVVHFAKPVIADAAYITSLGVPESKPCPLFVPAHRAPFKFDAQEVAKARMTPLPAGSPIHEPRPTCGLADREARLDSATPARLPLGEPPTGGQASVLIGLSPAGSVVLTGIEKSSGQGDFDQAAIESARNSKFSPGSFRCQPAGGIYLFVVRFTNDAP